jgi:hypothetical protein
MNHLTQISDFITGADLDMDIREGMLFIPDISGFTELVHTTDFMTGGAITFELLSAIIEYNLLGMQIAEIEGDAVFFYRYGKPPSTPELLNQYELMLGAFKLKLEDIQNRHGRKFPLALKLIAHYGKMVQFRIGGFEKLYGEVVIEAHRLLKNKVPSSSYVLITDELITKCTSSKKEELMLRGIRSSKLCEFYGGLREVCFTYFDYIGLKLE